VWRDGLEPRFRRLDGGEGDLLVDLAAGWRFGAACDGCGANSQTVGRWLQAWLSAGLVVPRD